MGLGREMALQLATVRARLVLGARSADRLTEVAQECAHRGGQAVAQPTDVAEPEQCRALVDAALNRYGRIDVLINNAGIGMTARFDETVDLSHYRRIMTTNYLGSVFTTHFALPHLKESRGRIGVISSLAGKTGVPLYSAYCGSKHALTGFFEALRIELETQHVTVTLIFPDFVATGIHERNINAMGELLGTDHGIDYRRAMSVEDCARKSLDALARRKRQILLSTRGKVGQWIKLITPQVIDRMAARAMEKGG